MWNGILTAFVLLTATRVNAGAPSLETKLETGIIKWEIMNTAEYPGKQDDIFFINRRTGWYVNGKGFIYKSTDGGDSWKQMIQKPGTYFRSIAMVNEKIGFAGNIGTNYFPNVTDTTPLYRTDDGGETWNPVRDVTEKMINGVCAIDILKAKFINSGQLDDRITIRAAGRVGGPAQLVTSRDGGKTWVSEDLTGLAAMIQDVKFVNEKTGFICAGSHSDVAKSHARILKTSDGGKTWRIVYESKRAYELTWKCAFPTEQTGYATVMSYEPLLADPPRYVARTKDGGETWEEVKLTHGKDVIEFGVGFLTEDIGWVGTKDGVYMTLNGGDSWTHQQVGHAINKIRVVGNAEDPLVFGIGKEVIRLK